MNNTITLSPFHYSILKYLYLNDSKPYSLGKITREIDYNKGNTENYSLKKQKEEVLKAINSLIMHKFVSEKYSNSSSKVKGSPMYRISSKGVCEYQKEIEKMKTTLELEKMINEDINKCDMVTTYEDLKNIKAKYNTYIEAVRIIELDYFRSKLDEDARMIKSALIAFKTFGYQNNTNNPIKTNIEIKNENVNSNTINIDISFDQVRDDIKNNTYLTDENIKEIISKIDELEAISNEKKTKKDKWQKAKSVLNWLSTQGVDIAVKVVPLILKLIAED